MIKLTRNNLLSAFSLALDLAENKILGHAKRTAYLALKLGRALGLSEEELNNVYAAAFLHDIGVTGARREYYKDYELLVAHPQIGSRIVDKLPFDPKVSQYVKLHHINWDSSNSSDFEKDLKGSTPPLGAQIVYISDQIDIRYDRNKPVHLQRKPLVEWVKNSSGTLFMPSLTEVFEELANKEKFWLDYNFFNIEHILSELEPTSEISVDLEQLEGISTAFALVIDNKSNFTLDHSHGLANLIEATTRYYGLSEEEVKKAKIAGLLHDLGKLAVPTQILDKPGKLDDDEYQVIKCHTYYTKVILGLVDGFEEIKEWAANHHETMDGQGYPEGIPGEKLSIVERLMAVCDVYQALTEDRPYRKPMAQSEAFKILESMVSRNKLCPESFNILKKVVV